MSERIPILIVDDHPANMKLVRFLLEKRGYQVTTAASADEALASLRANPPRLILTDLQMPGMDGYELTRKVKADPETANVVIIAVTAYAMKGDEKRAIAAGCDGYITKPIDTRTLPAVLAGYLSKKTPPK